MSTAPEKTTAPLLRAEGLCYTHVSSGREDGMVPGGVWDLSLSLYSGEIVAVIGPSGGGKSSLVRLLAGLTPPDRGKIWLQGRPIDAFELPRYRSQVGMLFQQPHMVAGTVAYNVELGARLAGDGVEGVDVPALLKAADLPAGLAARDARDLSVGQQQRVALARLLALEPRVLLLDEPTSALDPLSTKAVVTLLERLRERGMAILLVTHEMPIARRLADRVLVLVEGRLVEEGEGRGFFAAPRSEAARSFLVAEGESR